MSDRTDLVSGVLTNLDVFMAANPTLLRRRFKVRPPSLVTDLPCAYLDIRPETVRYDSALRERIFPTAIVFVDQLTDNSETESRMDLLVDAFQEHLDNYPHIAGTNTWWSEASWAEEKETLGGEGEGAPAAAARLTLEIHFLVGRL